MPSLTCCAGRGKGGAPASRLDPASALRLGIGRLLTQAKSAEARTAEAEETVNQMKTMLDLAQAEAATAEAAAQAANAKARHTNACMAERLKAEQALRRSAEAELRVAQAKVHAVVQTPAFDEDNISEASGAC